MKYFISLLTILVIVSGCASSKTDNFHTFKPYENGVEFIQYYPEGFEVTVVSYPEPSYKYKTDISSGTIAELKIQLSYEHSPGWIILIRYNKLRQYVFKCPRQTAQTVKLSPSE